MPSVENTSAPHTPGRAAVRLLWTALAVAALARLVLQMVVMPPYAGLDEIYHVARLDFVAKEGRNPAMAERSVPLYLVRTMERHPASLPAFGLIGPKWPAYLRARGAFRLPPQRALAEGERASWLIPNYEAQQPSAYYTVAAPLARLLPHRTAIDELRLWRGLSVALAWIAVLATALVGYRWFGAYGVLAGALLASFPTWLTLVVRVSNDALACALLAAAVAVTAWRPARGWAWLAEGLLWAGALSVKLYTWPALVALPLLWRFQRARRARIFLVAAICAIFLAATIVDLHMRTNNPLGLFAFDPSGKAAGTSPLPIDYKQMAKIVVATGIWTSGQHWNALRPAAMLAYFGPLILAALHGILRGARRHRQPLLLVVVVSLAFAAAQAVNAAGYIRSAQDAGLALPMGGKEGWYWYALAPFFVGMLLSLALHALSRWKPALLALVLWIVLWDMAISEGGLYRDYAGRTTPDRPSLLFRWGPSSDGAGLPATDVAVGPFAASAPAARAVHLAALSILAVAVLSRRQPGDRHPETHRGLIAG